MNDNPKISIIVPVYNTESFLSECIESLCIQTYGNTQIILVDDGSTDNSGVICDSYANDNPKIKVIHKPNGGHTSARMIGLDNSEGDYICFVDSDDWIDCDMCMTLIESAKVNSFPDMIGFGCIEEYPDRAVIRKNNITDKLYISDELSELKNSMLMSDNFFEWSVLPHLCDKMIRKDIICAQMKNVSEDIVFGEDAAGVFPCLLHSKSFLSLNYTPYHYRQRESSIVKSTNELPEKNFIDIYNVLSSSFGDNANLKKQLKKYMFFILMLKSYSRLSYQMPLFPFESVKNGERILVYTAGGFGKVIYDYVKKSSMLTLVGWTDKNCLSLQAQGLPVEDIDIILRKEYDRIVISILNEKVAVRIQNDLINMGVPKEKIVYINAECLEKIDLPDWLGAEK